MTISPLIATFLIVCAAIVYVMARRTRADVAAYAHAQAVDSSVDVFVRVAQIGTKNLPEQTRLRAQLAPPTEPGVVLSLRSDDGSVTKAVHARDVTAVRAWSHGCLTMRSGEPVHGATPLRPLSGQIAGWELEVSESNGTHVRLYADADSAVEFAEIRARLGRIHRALDEQRRLQVIAS